MAGRKSLPNQKKSPVRARLATNQAMDNSGISTDLIALDARLDILEAAPPSSYTTTNFNTDFGTKTTTDLAEGTNLYFTNARVDSRVTKAFVEGLSINVPWGNLTSVPSTFTPSVHTHIIADVTGLQTALDGKAATSHTHTLSQISDMSAYGRTLVDDVDSATARTTLGLGTAAVVNTGTSGATVPLLNGANTWGNVQTFGNGGLVLNGDAGTNRQFLIQSGLVNRWAYGVGGLAESGSNAGTDYLIARFDDAGGFLDVPIFISRSTGAVLLSATPTVAGSTVWHAGNDGAGSGLDADTLDGVQGSAYATLAGSQTFTGQKTFTVNGSAVNVLNSDQNYFTTYQRSSSIVGYTGADTTNFYWFDAGGVARAQIAWATGNIVARPEASATTTGTLAATSANRTIQATGDITINNSVFSAGDIILIYAGASARTITQGSGVTMRLGGTATTGSRTLAARGVAMLFFVSASEVVVSGGAVT